MLAAPRCFRENCLAQRLAQQALRSPSIFRFPSTQQSCEDEGTEAGAEPERNSEAGAEPEQNSEAGAGAEPERTFGSHCAGTDRLGSFIIPDLQICWHRIRSPAYLLSSYRQPMWELSMGQFRASDAGTQRNKIILARVSEETSRTHFSGALGVEIDDCPLGASPGLAPPRLAPPRPAAPLCPAVPRSKPPRPRDIRVFELTNKI